MQSVTENRKN